MGSYHYTSTSRFFFAGDGEGEFSSYKGTSTTNTHRPTTVRIPVASPAPERSPDDAAAARIQAAFRGHLVVWSFIFRCTCVKMHWKLGENQACGAAMELQGIGDATEGDLWTFEGKHRRNVTSNCI
uniref:Uncharacterized protein n=1 Tax=Oryza brachyantha TaxID=4533 RepID=J3LGI7_ORYBR